MSRLPAKLARTLVVGLLITACNSGASLTSPVTRASSAMAAAKPAGGADLCKKGGFANYNRTDGTTFKNQGDCVSYVEHGGVLVPVLPLPVITSFTYDGIQDLCSTGGGLHPLFTALFSGGTATITFGSLASAKVTSGVPVAYGPVAGGTFTLSATNSSGSTTRTLQPFPIGLVDECEVVGPTTRIPTNRLGRLGPGDQ